MTVRKASNVGAVAFAVAAVLIAAPSCEKQKGTPNADQTIKIVSSLPHTGSANAQTTTIVNGIRLAFDEIGWKVAGLTIEYLPWDDASPQRGTWDAQVEAENANKAIRDPDVMAYIGTYNSGAAKVAMPLLNKANLVMVSPANTGAGLTKPGLGERNEPMVYRPSGKVNYFRVVPADDIQGVVASDWAKEMGLKSVYVLHDREVYGKGIAEIFRTHADEIGLEVVGFDGIDVKAANYQSLATKIQAASPDLVYFGGTTQSNAGQLAKDIVASGFDVKLMVPDGCYENAFIEAAGAENLNDRTYVTFGGVPPDRLVGKGKEFYDAYKAKYNGAEPEGYAVYGYECAKVLIGAIERAATKDREGIRAAVAATKDFPGALGTWSFDSNGDTSIKTMSGNVIKDGKFEFVKVLGQ